MLLLFHVQGVRKIKILVMSHEKCIEIFLKELLFLFFGTFQKNLFSPMTPTWRKYRYITFNYDVIIF